MNRNYIKADSVEFQQIDDEGIFLVLVSGRYYRLNLTAADVWKTLGSSASTPDIVASLRDQYQSSPQEISSDVESIVERMLELGVIVEVGQDA